MLNRKYMFLFGILHKFKRGWGSFGTNCIALISATDKELNTLSAQDKFRTHIVSFQEAPCK